MATFFHNFFHVFSYEFRSPFSLFWQSVQKSVKINRKVTVKQFAQKALWKERTRMNINKHLILLFSVLFFLFCCICKQRLFPQKWVRCKECSQKWTGSVKKSRFRNYAKIHTLYRAVPRCHREYWFNWMKSMKPFLSFSGNLITKFRMSSSAQPIILPLFLSNWPQSIPKFLPEILKQNFSGHRSQSQPGTKRKYQRFFQISWGSLSDPESSFKHKWLWYSWDRL